MDQSAFFTRKTHNDGQKLSLFTPDGKKTEHFIVVRGRYSDEFRTRNTAALRKIATTENITPEEVNRIHKEVVASLVVDWSFETPCTIDAVVDFLVEAPQIEERVNAFANDMGNFVEKKSSTSSTLPVSTSNS